MKINFFILLGMAGLVLALSILVLVFQKGELDSIFVKQTDLDLVVKNQIGGRFPMTFRTENFPAINSDKGMNCGFEKDLSSSDG